MRDVCALLRSISITSRRRRRLQGVRRQGSVPTGLGIARHARQIARSHKQTELAPQERARGVRGAGTTQLQRR